MRQNEPVSQIWKNITYSTIAIVLLVLVVALWIQFEQRTSSAYRIAKQALDAEVNGREGSSVLLYLGSKGRVSQSDGVFTRCRRFDFVVRSEEGISVVYVYLRRLRKQEQWSIFSISQETGDMWSCMGREQSR